MKEKSKDGIQVISRAALILREVCASPDSLSLGQIALRTGLARATVQRIVNALEQENFLQAGAKGVRPGWGIRRLSDISGSSISHEIRPYLYNLYEKTKETVDLSTLDDGTVLFMDRFISDQHIRSVPDVGKKYLAYSMANGKSLLSNLPDTDIFAMYDINKLEKRTATTITDLNVLIEQIEGIRKGNFAYDIEEHDDEVCAIGLPLDTNNGMNLAISVVIPSYRFERQKELVEHALIECIEQCNTRLRTLTEPR